MRKCKRCGRDCREGDEIGTDVRACVCFACTRKRQTDTQRRRRRERIASDPDYRERERKRTRDYARRRWAEDPEFRKRRAAITKAYRNRMKAERPERWQQWLEDQRMAYRLRREQEGNPVKPLSPEVYAKRYGTGYGGAASLPVEPLRQLVRNGMTFFTQGELEALTGVPARRFYSLITEETQHVSLPVADKICSGLEIPLSLVYPEAS